jgi:hypothetical protein
VRLGDDHRLLDRWLSGLINRHDRVLALNAGAGPRHGIGPPEVRPWRKRRRTRLVGAGPAHASRHAGTGPASGISAGAVVKMNECMTTPESSNCS